MTTKPLRTTTSARVAVLHPTRRTPVVYGNYIGQHPDGRIAVNCDDGSARYVHAVNIRHLDQHQEES